MLGDINASAQLTYVSNFGQLRPLGDIRPHAIADPWREDYSRNRALKLQVRNLRGEHAALPGQSFLFLGRRTKVSIAQRDCSGTPGGHAIVSLTARHPRLEGQVAQLQKRRTSGHRL